MKFGEDLVYLLCLLNLAQEDYFLMCFVISNYELILDNAVF